MEKPNLKAKQKKNWQWIKKPAAKTLFSISRWLHVYLSTALFSLLFFFSLTGIFLNHLDWFDSEGVNRIEEININANFNESEPDLNNIAKSVHSLLSKTHPLPMPRKTTIDNDLGEITLDYSLPAGYAFATIMPTEGIVELEIQQGSLIALLNDLHKGRHSGESWSLLIDISAVLICLFSITGIILLLQQIKWRTAGFSLVVAGTLFPIAIYFLFVPGS